MPIDSKGPRAASSKYPGAGTAQSTSIQDVVTCRDKLLPFHSAKSAG
jgi:hypothetical protein